jgi:hypothetical protein
LLRQFSLLLWIVLPSGKCFLNKRRIPAAKMCVERH